jgi:hypothetical protein
MNNLLFDFWLAWVNTSNLKYLGCGLIKCPSNLGAAPARGSGKGHERKNECRNKFAKMGMVTNCFKILSVNGVCVPKANSMAGRALAASFYYLILIF